jgi:drug/metabolite transporter (DMT)-like permease
MPHGYRTGRRAVRPGDATEPARQPVVGYGNVGAVVRPVVAPLAARPVGMLSWLALGVVYVLWGSTYLANKLIIASVAPLLLGGVRFLVGGSLLGLVVLATAGRRAFRMTRAQLGTTALSGLLLPAWGNGLVALGQQQVASGMAALLIASVPLYIVLLRALTGDRPRTATFLGVGVGVVGLGVLLLAGPSGGSGGVFGNAWWGPWLVVVAALGWATGTFCTTRLPVPPNPFALAAVQMLVGGFVLLSISLGIGDRLDVAAVTPVAWWAWAYMSVVVSLGAFSAYAYALATLPVSTVATYAYVNPVIAVLLGVLVVGERFSAVQLLGGAIVLVAVLLVIVAERPSRPPADPAPASTG